MKRQWLPITMSVVFVAMLMIDRADQAGGGDPHIPVMISAGQAVLAQQPAGGTEKTVKPLRGRVPSHMGQIGLSDRQRTNIYAIQHEYSAPIKELETKLAELRKRQMDEILKVLTATQRARYDRLVENAQKRRSKQPAASP